MESEPKIFLSQSEEIRKLAYKRGFLNGIEAYAWMKDGVYYVGSTGKTLREAQDEVEQTYNYNP